MNSHMLLAQAVVVRRSALVCALASALLGLACNERPRGTGGGGVATGTSQTAPKKSTPLKLESLEEETEAPPKKLEPPEEPSGQVGVYQELTTRFGLGQLQDIGPAAPATATPRGVVFVSRDDHLVIARRVAKTGQVTPLDLPKEAFAKYGRGPAVSPTHAYWVSERNLLMRASLKTLTPEVLFEQARMGTRTSVVTVAGRDVVTFIAEIDKQPLAYVFASKSNGKHEITRLTPEGATATSVALVRGTPHPRAIVLAGRLGMSPVHVRRVRVTEKRVTLEPDEVVWIAPGSHVLTEIFATEKKGDDAVAFLSTAKDFSDFGLAQLEIASEPGEIPPPEWLIYKNGLDPAPVAATTLCGKPHVMFARPTEQRPRSPQELVVAPIEGTSPGEGEIIGRTRAYADLSVTTTESGVLVVWTADHRTWAMPLTCPEQSASPK